MWTKLRTKMTVQNEPIEGLINGQLFCSESKLLGDAERKRYFQSWEILNGISLSKLLILSIDVFCARRFYNVADKNNMAKATKTTIKEQ